MCGIAGQLVLDADGTIDEDKIVPMISVLAHRGPDEWGYYVDDAAAGHARARAVVDHRPGHRAAAAGQRGPHDLGRVQRRNLRVRATRRRAGRGATVSALAATAK